jgi:hypothetical protein
LHTVAEGQTLGDQVVDDEIECAFAEEVCAYVEIARVFCAESESILGEAEDGDMGQCR